MCPDSSVMIYLQLKQKKYRYMLIFFHLLVNGIFDLMSFLTYEVTPMLTYVRPPCCTLAAFWMLVKLPLTGAAKYFNVFYTR
jgi:hypothetical protein